MSDYKCNDCGCDDNSKSYVGESDERSRDKDFEKNVKEGRANSKVKKEEDKGFLGQVKESKED